MKAKYFLLAILCLNIVNTSEAQFLKKLKKKAQNAAERSILKKTDEIVTEKTEKTIDDVTDGTEKEPDSTTKSPEQNQQNETISQSKNKGAFNSNDASTNVPEVYSFDWEFKTILESEKNDPMDMN